MGSFNSKISKLKTNNNFSTSAVAAAAALAAEKAAAEKAAAEKAAAEAAAKAKAEALVDYYEKQLVKVQKEQNKIKTSLNLYIQSYDTEYSNSLLQDELLQKFKTENKELKNEIDNYIKTYETANRKVFYEEQGIDNLIWYKSLIINIYWALLIIFFFLLLWNGFIFVPRYIFYLLLYIAFPFISLYLVKKLYQFMGFLISLLPTNKFV